MYAKLKWKSLRFCFSSISKLTQKFSHSKNFFLKKKILLFYYKIQEEHNIFSRIIILKFEQSRQMVVCGVCFCCCYCYSYILLDIYVERYYVMCLLAYRSFFYYCYFVLPSKNKFFLIKDRQINRLNQIRRIILIC